jgi:hypothetical protein
MNEPEPTPCLHCERRPRARGLALCAACRAVPGIRRLYLRRRDQPPGWEEHLMRLAERAKRRQPLFEEPPEPGATSDAPHDPA